MSRRVFPWMNDVRAKSVGSLNLPCLLLALVTVPACASVPASVKLYAGGLPARADGQYAPLPDPIKKQLVTNDSLLQCEIDVEGGTAEAASPACQCSKSTGDWTADCKAWLGAHTPAGAAAPAPSSTSTPAAPPS